MTLPSSDSFFLALIATATTKKKTKKNKNMKSNRNLRLDGKTNIWTECLIWVAGKSWAGLSQPVWFKPALVIKKYWTGFTSDEPHLSAAFVVFLPLGGCECKYQVRNMACCAHNYRNRQWVCTNSSRCLRFALFLFFLTLSRGVTICGSSRISYIFPKKWRYKKNDKWMFIIIPTLVMKNCWHYSSKTASASFKVFM